MKRLTHQLTWTPLLLLCLAVTAQAAQSPDAESASDDDAVEEAPVSPGLGDDDRAADQAEGTIDVQPLRLQSPLSAEKPKKPVKVAPNVDLKEVAPEADKPVDEEPLPEPAASEVVAGQAAPDTTDDSGPTAATGTDVLGPVRPLAQEPLGQTQPVLVKTPEPKDFLLLDRAVEPGTATRLSWRPDVTFPGLAAPTPVLVVHGESPGPVLCMTAAVHGDELNGIEIVRRVLYDIDPAALSGTLVGVPIVNVHGFQRSSRYLPDRRDLNRHFPGNPDGSLASRVAYSLFDNVIRHCDYLVDLHTGSLKRTNLPQLRADMDDPEIAEFTKGFDEMVVVHSEGTEGMLRTAASEAGIVAVTMEVGESLRIQEAKIKRGVDSINSLLEREGLYSRLWVWGDPEPVYYQSNWVRADQGGILFSQVSLGDRVRKGQVLGTVTDPITNEKTPIRSDYEGRIIGMAVDQFVMAGFAAYHIGTEAQGPEVSE
ncbi:succinylglutamate desuccinylase/aspartoacylase family protein [Marinobacteraceae bacterium S3BR75-40.1]